MIFSPPAQLCNYKMTKQAVPTVFSNIARLFASSSLSAMGIRHLLIPQVLHTRAKFSPTVKRHKNGNICQSKRFRTTH